MIVREAKAAGVDPKVMLMKVHVETGGSFDPWSKNSKTGASGLSQIMPKNFSVYGLNSKTALNPLANIRAGIEHHIKDTAYFQSRMGRAPSREESYLLHQQGAAGGIALLLDPNRKAADALKRFYKPGVNTLAITQNGGQAHWSAGQFTAMWKNKAQEILNKF